MDKKETLYNIALAIKFCESLDENTQEIDSLLGEINKEKLRFENKKNKFKSYKFFLIYLIVFLLSLIPFSVLTLFVELPLNYFAPLFGLLITFIVKLYYEKSILPKLQKTHNQVLKNKEKQLNTFINLLYSDCEKYDFYFMDIPKELHYNIALLFIHEAIRHDYAKTIQEGVILYKDQLEKIKNNTSEKAALLIQEVNTVISQKEKRESIIEKYITIE